MSKSTIILGLVYGIFGFLNSYLMMNNSIGMWTAMGLGFLIFIICCVLTVLMYRKANGHSRFKEIFGAMLIMGLIGSIIGLIMNQGYISALSIEKIALMEENFIDSQLSYYESLGMPDEQINEMEDALTAQFSNMFNLKAQLIGLPISFLFLTVIALIVGLIMKKEDNPLQME